MRAAALCLIASALLAAPLRGQESTGPRGMICDDGFTTLPVLRVGQTNIRFEAEQGELVEGALLSCSGTVLVIDAADSLRLVDVSRAARLEVGYPVGNRSKGFLRGALIGGVSGGVLAGAIGHMVFNDCPAYVTCDLGGVFTVFAALGGAAAGALLGGVIGAENPPVRSIDWEPVTLNLLEAVR